MSIETLFDRAGVAVAIRDLRKTYRIADQVFVALDAIDCDVRPGEFTILMGPSGCGKTTFMNVLGGVDWADSGRVCVDGAKLANERDSEMLASYRLCQVGFVFQGFNLIPQLGAAANIELPLAARAQPAAKRRARALALLELVGLHGKADKRPDELSGGEQQRVAIAVALANDPPLILADEPTGNLDSANAGQVTELLLALATRIGKTVLVATHDDAVAAYGSCHFRMCDGRLERLR